MRLPIFGSKANIIERTDETQSMKGFLQMKDQEFYYSAKVFGNQAFGVLNAQQHKYVLDPVASMFMHHQNQDQT